MVLERTDKHEISAETSLFIAGLVFSMGMATSTIYAQATKPGPPTPMDVKKVELGGRPGIHNGTRSSRRRTIHPKPFSSRRNNLEWGVKILFNQIIVRHKSLLPPRDTGQHCIREGLSYRVFAKQTTNPPSAWGLSTKSTIDKSATTKTVRDTQTVKLPSSFR
jgi:hypothetical protein